MSEPPKKRLKQSTIGEGFQKQLSMDKNGKDENQASKSAQRQKILKAAEKRRDNKSPNVTPTHETDHSIVASENNEGPSCSTSATELNVETEGTDMVDSQGSAMSASEEEKLGFYDEASMEALLAEEVEFHSQNKKLDSKPFKGTPRHELKITPTCAAKLKPLSLGDKSYCTVLFDSQTLKGNTPPKPSPKQYQDKWDAHHVKLPCSSENMYPVQGKDGKKDIKSRWEVIQEALLNDIMTTDDLEDAIKSYNTRYSQKWDFSGLHSFFSEVMDVEEREQFFDTLLPAMKSLALRMPSLCTQGIPLLRKNYKHTVMFTQEQVACILANAFFCTFPRRNARGKMSEYSSYPDINFNRLFEGSKKGINVIKAEKLKCILHYFKCVTKKMPTGTVSFRRQVIDKPPEWEHCHDRLTRLHVSAKGTIEDEGEGMLQMVGNQDAFQEQTEKL